MEDKSSSEGWLCALPATLTADSGSLVNSVGFDLIGSDLGKDVESALQVALAGGAVFPDGTDPLFIFRQALSASIRDIESHPRGRLFQEFLLKDPYEDAGEIPMELVGQRLSDAESASAITFIYSHMVNCFKGAVAELLAAKACLHLLKQLQQKRKLPADARLYVGDVVGVHRAKGKGLLKGADLYVLIEEHRPDAVSSITVAGVTEVKSYIQSKSRLRKQLDQHVRQAKRGLRVDGVDYPAERVNVGYERDRRVVRIAVLPSDWKLPRSFWFEDSESGRLLHVDRGEPPRIDDEITQIEDNEWRITLRWSKEALAEASYEMTFWYMKKIGEVIYSKRTKRGQNDALLCHSALPYHSGGATGHCSLQQLRTWLCTGNELQEHRRKARDALASGPGSDPRSRQDRERVHCTLNSSFRTYSR
jgi:hypothetical protein